MLPLTADIIALKQRLDDVRTCGGAADAILFHQLAQRLVVYETASRLHGPEQRGFGVGLWRGGLFLYERWLMWPALALSEGWQHGLFRRFFLRGLFILLLAALPLEDGAPSWLQNLSTGGLEIDLGRGACDGRCCDLTVGIKSGNETSRHKVIHPSLIGRKPCRCSRTGGDDGVVIRHLLVVKHPLVLRDRCSGEWCGQGGVIGHPFQYSGHLRVKVFAEVRRVYARVGGHLLFIEGLDQAQRLLGRERETAVALDLQGGQVEELWGRLTALLFRDIGHGEGLPLDGTQQGLALLLLRESSV